MHEHLYKSVIKNFCHTSYCDTPLILQIYYKTVRKSFGVPWRDKQSKYPSDKNQTFQKLCLKTFENVKHKNIFFSN